MVEVQTWYFPIISVICFVITFTITYTLAVIYQHVHPFWPFISDTGTLLPESLYFSEMLIIAAIPTSFTYYFRYEQMKIDINKYGNQKSHQCMNITCGVLSVVMVFGLTIVANFQITTSRKIHSAGACLVFVGCMPYMIIMTVLSFSASERSDKVSYRLNVFRAVLTVFYIIFFWLMLFFGFKSRSAFSLDRKNPVKYTPTFPHYIERVISTLSEWFLSLVMDMYLLTFVHDFKKLKFQMTCVYLDARYTL